MENYNKGLTPHIKSLIDYNNERYYEKMDHDIILWAIENGYLDILKYIHKKSEIVIDNSRFIDKSKSKSYQFMEVASKSGHVEIIKFLHKTVGCEVDGLYLFEIASKNGHFHVINYLNENINITRDFEWSYSQIHTPMFLYGALMNGHIDIVRYFVLNHSFSSIF